MKYIYYTENRGYHVMKQIKGKMVSFGFYDELETAKYVRDEMIKFRWNKDYLKGVQRRGMENEII